MLNRRPRRITLTGVVYALDESHAKIRAMVLAGKLEAWVYDERGMNLIQYTKLDKARHPMIYVYEEQLGKFLIVNPLPPLEHPLPPGRLLLKNGAATILGCTPHWIHQRAESGKIRAWVYDQWGVNLIPLEEKEHARKQNARVLHFLESDVKAYKKKIAAYKDEPLTPRLRKNFTAEEKQKVIAMANEQLKTKSYVSMQPIRKALALPLDETYDDAIRQLREEQGWPMSHMQQQVSRARTKRNRTVRKRDDKAQDLSKF
jgi:hypothetical protein